MNKTKAIIVDDAPNARKLLRLMLSELCPNLLVVNEAENVAQAIELIAIEKPKIVFLDIEMPGKSGLQLLENIVKEKIDFQVIFTTAYNQYAVQAFRLNAIDYLLKPINEDHLKEAVDKAIKQINLHEENIKLNNFIHHYKNNELTLTIPQGSSYVYIKVDDIMYVKADGSYTHICTIDNKTAIVSKNLKHFESILANCENFVRVHRKYLININHIKQYNKQNRGTIIMKDDSSIDLARDRRTSFLANFK